MVDHHFTEAQFVYICYRALVARIYRMAEELGYVDTSENLWLDNDVRNFKAVPFPEIICQYIESLGLVEAFYTHYVPNLPNFDDFVRDIQLPQLNVNGAFIHNILCTSDNFREQPFTVAQYTTALTRAWTVAKGFRYITFSTQGTYDYLISYRFDQIIGRSNIMIYSPISTSESIAKRGGVFRFWNEDDFRDEGDHLQVPAKFHGKSFDEENYIATMISQSMAPMD